MEEVKKDSGEDDSKPSAAAVAATNVGTEKKADEYDESKGKRNRASNVNHSELFLIWK